MIFFTESEKDLVCFFDYDTPTAYRVPHKERVELRQREWRSRADLCVTVSSFSEKTAPLTCLWKLFLSKS